ncbi:hypothetical protein PT285_11260 [Lactobacillus sp. ESL0791]|uniref:hypothetical protein n=1 Tax=Lactobacillus sp. ESL0791 TaxID=2983234 RepID=UPI0023F66284|nr:hypothetical protein [Lactobacillus sp. ESL0791]MDF7639980.1 hypothetical protein [Lactobacillus sp. ESL0791]
MVKTVNEIASGLVKNKKDLVREKQRVRDEIKRQQIKTQKEKNRFVVSDKDAAKIADALRDKASSNKDDELAVLKKKYALLQQENEQVTKENQRLSSKIEKYADDFKDLNDKQLQLNNQQQQLQARILEQTKELKDSQQKLLEAAEKRSELQDKVDKVTNASLWQRITGHFD